MSSAVTWGSSLLLLILLHYIIAELTNSLWWSGSMTSGTSDNGCFDQMISLQSYEHLIIDIAYMSPVFQVTLFLWILFIRRNQLLIFTLRLVSESSF